MEPGDSVTIRVTTDLLKDEVLVDAPGHLYTGLPAGTRGQDLVARPVVATAPGLDEATSAALGIDVRVAPPASSALCRRLLEAATSGD
jgi:hypothetical protein